MSAYGGGHVEICRGEPAEVTPVYLGPAGNEPMRTAADARAVRPWPLRLASQDAGPVVTVFLRPLSPCDLVRAESKLAARATPFCPSPLRHKRHSANWAPNICCSNHIGCCVARTFHLPSFVFSRSLHSVFHTLVASMVLFPCFKWVAIRQARIAVEGF
jgi:hypothetical protein